MGSIAFLNNSLVAYIASLSAYIASLSVYIASLSAYIASLSAYIASLSAYIASLSAYIASLSAYIASLSAYIASLRASGVCSPSCKHLAEAIRDFNELVSSVDALVLDQFDVVMHPQRSLSGKTEIEYHDLSVLLHKVSLQSFTTCSCLACSCSFPKAQSPS